MPDRWVIDDEYPNGHLVPMTPAEEAQHESAQASGTEVSEVEATRNANQAEIRAALESRMEALRKARSALSDGVIFKSFSAKEKKVIDALLEDDLQLARLGLGLFDSTDDTGQVR